MQRILQPQKHSIEQECPHSLMQCDEENQKILTRNDKIFSMIPIGMKTGK